MSEILDGVKIVGGTGDFDKLTGGMEEIIKASSGALSGKDLRGAILSNYGQAAANNLQTLPTAAEGMNFVAVCGAAQGAHYFRLQADTSDKIYLDGVAGSDNGYVEIAAPAVGAMIVFMAFQTGATTFDWIAVTISGTWGAG